MIGICVAVVEYSAMFLMVALFARAILQRCACASPAAGAGTVSGICRAVTAITDPIVRPCRAVNDRLTSIRMDLTLFMAFILVLLLRTGALYLLYFIQQMSLQA